MTTRRRIDLLARAYPRLFPRAELLRLVREQLGHIDAETSSRDDVIRFDARGPVTVKLEPHPAAVRLR